MADVQECVEKLVNAGQITRAVGDAALDAFRRSKGQYTKTMGPVGADAAAALQAAKEMQNTAARAQMGIASYVKTWRTNEQRVIEDPRGGMLQINALLAKDTLLGDPRLKELMRTNPQHPIFTAGSVDSNANVLRRDLYNLVRPAMEKFKGKGMANAPDVIHELLNVDTGNKDAKEFAQRWAGMKKEADNRALMAGKDFDPTEGYFPQPWESRRVKKFSEPEFVKDFQSEIDAGGIKVRDKGEPPSAATLFAPAHPGFYAAPDRVDGILKKAYEDIKMEGGANTPFSKYMRTFEFQPNKAGAEAWLRLQAKYGVGNEIMSMFDKHIDQMAHDIALHEIFGPNPQAQFEALVRLAKVKNPKEALSPGLRRFGSELTARNTFDQLTGSGNPVGNEEWARKMAGARSVVGAAALPMLPVAIVPSDIFATFLSAWHDGISGFDVIWNTIRGGMSRQEAAQLQIAGHSHTDYVQNRARRYPDEINVSGLARLVPEWVTRATGAHRWTENIRLGSQLGFTHTLANVADRPWEQLDPALRENFLMQYGITPAEWDKIRAIPPNVAPNGAHSVNLPVLTQMDRELSERLQRAIGERSSYYAHQPDARTRALVTGAARRGTIGGEAMLSAGQYKQFAFERMSTHLMRTLYEGSGSDRVKYGIAWLLSATAAGALSLQAAEILAGKNPHDMSDPKFWIRSFAKGGAGGVYGDLLADALVGDQRMKAGLGFLGGPVGGLVADVGSTLLSPLKEELVDKRGSRVTTGPAGEAFATLKRWGPKTWYTKLPVDRLIWEQLQTLLDPHYRDSFRRAQQLASRKGGTGYWWAPGETRPGFMQ